MTPERETFIREVHDEVWHRMWDECPFCDLLAEVDTLREALGHYAEESTWSIFGPSAAETFPSFEYGGDEAEPWAIARAALPAPLPR